MSLTVACVFVEGEVAYSAEYVYNLEAMASKWIDQPFDFVCLTDRPYLLPGIKTKLIRKFPDCFAYWNKLRLFDPIMEWPGRVLYLDLDVLVVAPLAPIIDHPAPFVITGDPTGKTGLDAHGRKIIRRFNSSVMAWDGWTQHDLYTEWTQEDADRLSGDQDYLAEAAIDPVALPRAWFPRLSEVPNGPPFGEAKVILTKHPKNHLAVKRYPWLEPLWRTPELAISTHNMRAKRHA